jgi:hypothetical protein
VVVGVLFDQPKPAGIGHGAQLGAGDHFVG